MVKKFDLSPDQGNEVLSERMRNFGRSGFNLRTLITGAVGTIAIIGALGYATCTKYVKPNENGIMQVDMNLAGLMGEKGVHTNVIYPGVHIQIPGFQKIHTLPMDIQALTLKSEESSNEEPKSKYVRMTKPVHIQTSDGFYIDVDASLLYRVDDPYKVITTIGPGRLFEDNGLIPQAEPVLKKLMGKLTPEDFFDTKKRVIKQEESRKELNSILGPKGLFVEHVLVRFPHYHPTIQAKIEGRILQEQAKLSNIAMGTESAAKSQLKKVVEEGLALVNMRLMTGSNYVTRKTAAMLSYETMKKSDADTLKQAAEARRTELMNEAYQGVGSERVVAMQMAEVLKGLDYILVPTGGEKGFNPLDLEAMSRAFQIQQKQEAVK